MVKYNTIGLEALNTSLAEGSVEFLLDVRGPSEAEEKGHIEGAVMIPLRDLAKNIAYLRYTNKFCTFGEKFLVFFKQKFTLIGHWNNL